MTSSPARRLILAYGAVSGCINLLVWLSDSMSFTNRGGVLFGLAIQALILWRLWLGSPAAWVIALGLDLLTIVGLALIGMDRDIAIYLFLAAVVARVMILVSRPVRAHVWSRRHPRAALG